MSKKSHVQKLAEEINIATFIVLTVIICMQIVEVNMIFLLDITILQAAFSHMSQISLICSFFPLC